MSEPRPADLPAIRIEPENEWAWCGERRLSLTPRAFAVLRHLVERPHRLITKDDLFAAIWGDTIVSEAALASCIRDLRQALGDSPREPRYIETVHRRGFRFIGPIARPPSADSPREAPAADLDVGAATVPSGVSPKTAALVGREPEMGRLATRLARAVEGQRQLVFVTGEPGIGKTALVETFLARIGAAHRLCVGHGQCVEQYGAGEAYLPVLEALGRLGRGPGGERLVQILRQHAATWLVQLPGLLSDRDVEAVQRRAQGATRERMLRELVEALDAFSLDTPLVLVLEDLHWSDSATIDLLAMLARRTESARLFVIGTYRAAEVAAGAHPLRSVKQELLVHGRCEELPLELLNAAAVAEYLALRFPRHAFPPELAAVLHRNTEGNPLFLLNTIDDLTARGHLRDQDGQWSLSGPLDAIAMDAPETLWQMVDKHVERLTAEEQAMLAVASVAGAEFSAAIAAAAGIDAQDGDRQCAALARRGQFLRSTGVAQWPDGTVAGQYAFIHALYRDVLYARLPAGHRAGLHLKVGECLERGYGARAGEIAGELAMHFERGRDVERAVRYRHRAGAHALRQHGYREAAEHARRALGPLESLPDSPERLQQELGIQVLLGAALTAIRGYAVPEVARAYARARDLCAQLGDTPQSLPVLVGLARFYLVRGDFRTAREVGAHLLALAEAKGDAALLLAGHNILGNVSFYSADFEAALVHLERGIEVYDPEQHSPARSPVLGLGQDPGVSCLIHAGLTLWMLGYPARAAARVEEAIALGRSLGHPFSAAHAYHFAAGFYQWRRERQRVQELSEAAFAIDAEHGFELFLTAGALYRGWLACEDGRGEEGVAEMRQALARHRAIGAEVLVPAFLAMVAEVHEKLGQSDEGLATVAEALEVGRQSGQYYWEAELYRLRGALTLLARAEPASTAAPGENPESWFLEALETARRQRAQSLELRAATSLARLWASQGRTAKARALLSDVYRWFTEGFDTPDLRDARSLLDALRGSQGGESP